MNGCVHDGPKGPVAWPIWKINMPQNALITFIVHEERDVPRVARSIGKVLIDCGYSVLNVHERKLVHVDKTTRQTEDFIRGSTRPVVIVSGYTGPIQWGSDRSVHVDVSTEATAATIASWVDAGHLHVQSGGKSLANLNTSVRLAIVEYENMK